MSNRPIKKNDIGIEATNIHDTESARITDAFPTKSSFPSSQPDSVVSKEVEDGDSLKADLNGTNTATFLADSEIDFTNGSAQLQQQEIDVQVNESDTKPSIESPQEDIPSFREWSAQQIAEKEKERGILAIFWLVEVIRELYK